MRRINEISFVKAFRFRTYMTQFFNAYGEVLLQHFARKISYVILNTGQTTIRDSPFNNDSKKLDDQLPSVESGLVIAPREVWYSCYMKQTDDMMTETVTVTGRIRQEAKDRLKDIVRESGRDEEELVGEAVERLLNDDYWEKEVSRRLAVSATEQRFVDPHEMDKWVQSLRDGKPVPAPEAKAFS